MSNPFSWAVAQIANTQWVARKEPGYQAQVRDIDTRIGETMTRLNVEVSKVKSAAAR